MMAINSESLDLISPSFLVPYLCCDALLLHFGEQYLCHFRLGQNVALQGLKAQTIGLGSLVAITLLKMLLLRI